MGRLGLIGVFVAALLGSSLALAGESESKAAKEPTQEVRSSQRDLHIRSGPGVYYDILKNLDAGVELTVLEDGKRWIKVRHGKQTVGWVSSRVFSKRTKRMGYGALLGEQGLKGVSATVVTMATQGFGNLGSGGGMDGVIMDFLAQRAFTPGEWVRFAQVLPGRPVPKLPGWMRQMGVVRQVDDGQAELERRLGMRLAAQVLQDVKLITDRNLDRYVNQVGTAILSATSHYDQSWRFVVFDDDEAEAFALPGGVVFVSSGLIVELSDEAELAGVLAHQVAHVLLGHDLDALRARLGSPNLKATEEQRMQRLLEEAYRLARAPRPAEQEIAADAYGAAFAVAAGYDPMAFVRFIQRNNAFEARGADYPKSEVRQQTIEQVAKTFKPARLLSLKKRFEQATTPEKT